MAEKYDVFVGNLTFNTTEDQLREMFSFVGMVKSVRVLSDKDTGKPKGFAFVEYYDSNTALAAIKHLDGRELNARKIKVGFPAQSNLREIAKQLGEQIHGLSGPIANTEASIARFNAETAVVQAMELHEAWDVLDALKKMLQEDRRGNKLRVFAETYPQCINAVYELEKRLGIALPTHILMNQPQLLQDNTNNTNNMNNNYMAPPPPPAGPPPLANSSSSAAPISDFDYYQQQQMQMQMQQQQQLQQQAFQQQMFATSQVPPQQQLSMNYNAAGNPMDAQQQQQLLQQQLLQQQMQQPQQQQQPKERRSRFA